MLAQLQQLTAALISQAAPAPSAADGFTQMIPMFLIIFGVMYFMVLRPQAKERKEHQSMLEALKRGDEIITSSGILGKITDISDTIVTLEVSRNVKIRVLRSAVAKKHADPTPEEEPAKASKT